MTLKEFLEFFEFGYQCHGDEIQLIDYTGANLGNIQSERFEREDLSSLVDRLDIYYQDYLFNDLASYYGVDPNDWRAILNKAKDDNNQLLDYLEIIMGEMELSMEEEKCY